MVGSSLKCIDCDGYWLIWVEIKYIDCSCHVAKLGDEKEVWILVVVMLICVDFGEKVMLNMVLVKRIIWSFDFVLAENKGLVTWLDFDCFDVDLCCY